MLTTLGKFKRIYKQGRLTAYQKQRPPVNRVFAEMSSFFHTKKNNA